MDKSTFTREYRILTDLLRRERVKAGLTQDALAEKLGETQSFVSKCERGERRLDLIQLQQFCRAIGVELADFVKKYQAQAK